MISGKVLAKVESPLQQEVAALLILSDLVAERLYPGEYRRPITPEFLALMFSWRGSTGFLSGYASSLNVATEPSR